MLFRRQVSEFRYAAAACPTPLLLKRHMQEQASHVLRAIGASAFSTVVYSKSAESSGSCICAFLSRRMLSAAPLCELLNASTYADGAAGLKDLLLQLIDRV